MDDADLEKLIVKPGGLKPKFNRNVVHYEVVLNSGVKELKIDPLTRDHSASWTIPGVGTERNIAITEGCNFDLVIEVTAEDGTVKSYTLRVIPLAASSASISSLKVRGHRMQPACFQSSIYKYECVVPVDCCAVEVLTVTPDKNTKVVVNEAVENVNKLNYSSTKITVDVTSPDGSKSLTYEISVTRRRFLYVFNKPTLQCQACLAYPHCPVNIRNGDDDVLFCKSCLETLTRTRKIHPFSGLNLEDDFIAANLSAEQRLSDCNIHCPLSCGSVFSLREMAGHLKDVCAERWKLDEQLDVILYTKNRNEDRETCKGCSRMVPTLEKTFHDKDVCTSSHEFVYSSRIVKFHSWEEKYAQGVLGRNTKNVIEEAKEAEERFHNRIQNGEVTESCLDELELACQWYSRAINGDERDHSLHYKLGKMLETQHFFNEVLGLKQKASKTSLQSTDGDGGEFMSNDSMEDDIRALTEQRGYGVSIVEQIKALDEEYHCLLDHGQSEKADYVQKLYAFKQKQAHKSDQVRPLQRDDETMLGRALLKYLDAASLEPINGEYHARVAKCMMLLRRNKQDVVKRLKNALALKPMHVEARFYLALCQGSGDGLPKDVFTRYLTDGLIWFIHNQCFNSECVNLTSFASLYNNLLVNGFIMLAELPATESTLFSPRDSLIFSSAVCFYAMSCLVNRGVVFETFQKLAVQCQYLLGNLLVKDENVSRFERIEYWERLSRLAQGLSKETNHNALEMQLKICESAVLLSPCRTQTLNNYGEALYKLTELSPSLTLNDQIESVFRASIALEGQNMYSQEIPHGLEDVKLWKDRSSCKDVGGTSKTVVQRKVMSLTRKTARPKPQHKGAVARGRGMSKSPALKTTGAKTTVADIKSFIPPAKQPGGSTSASMGDEVITKNKKIHENRLGLARVLVKGNKNPDEVLQLYNEVIEMSPNAYDAYIELGELMARENPLAAVDVYCKFPFREVGEHSFDSAYLYEEIVRALMKEK